MQKILNDFSNKKSSMLIPAFSRDNINISVRHAIRKGFYFVNHITNNSFSYKSLIRNTLNLFHKIFRSKIDSSNAHFTTKYVAILHKECELSEIAPQIFGAFNLIDYYRDYENTWEWIQNDPKSTFHLNISRPHNWEAGDYKKPVEVTFKRNGIILSETESLLAAIRISIATRLPIRFESHNFKNSTLIREPILAFDTDDFSPNPNLNKALNSNAKNEILALIALAVLLKSSDDSAYSSLSASDAHSFICDFTRDLLSDREPNFNKLSVALLPTSWIQEISMSNGWSNCYLDIAAILDGFIEQRMKPNHK